MLILSKHSFLGDFYNLIISVLGFNDFKLGVAGSNGHVIDIMPETQGNAILGDHKSKGVEQVDTGLLKGGGGAVPKSCRKAVQGLKQADDIGGAGRDGHGLN